MYTLEHFYKLVRFAKLDAKLDSSNQVNKIFYFIFHDFCIEVEVKQTAPEISVLLTFIQDIDGPHDSMVKRGLILAAFSIINEKIIRVQSVKINLQC